jgi:hypothetical protein
VLRDSPKSCPNITIFCERKRMERGNAAEMNPNTNLANSKKRSQSPMMDPICVVIPSWIPWRREASQATWLATDFPGNLYRQRQVSPTLTRQKFQGSQVPTMQQDNIQAVIGETKRALCVVLQDEDGHSFVLWLSRDWWWEPVFRIIHVQLIYMRSFLALFLLFVLECADAWCMVYSYTHT